MADESIIYERNMLYEEVWAEPMRDVAKRYGVSDVALAKTCRRLGVPVPGRGYWAKLKAGKADARPSLPKPDRGQPERILAQRWTPPAKPSPMPGLDEAVPIDIGEPIIVPSILEHPHKLVALSARYLLKAHPVDGLVSASQRSCLDIRVAPESLDRALRIFDALLGAMETAGLKAEIALVEDEEPARSSYYGRVEREPRPPTRVTRVLCDEEWIEFCLTEEVRRIKGPPPTAIDERIHTWGTRSWAYEPTGQLSLQLTNVEQLGVRGKWQDGKRQRLEDCLSAFVAYLSTVALAFKLKREEDARRAIEEREAAQRRYEEEMRRLEEAERQRKEELREEQLEAEVALWRRAEDIRAYARATLAALGDGGASAEDGQSVRERMQWAVEYADRIDPLRGHRSDVP